MSVGLKKGQSPGRLQGNSGSSSKGRQGWNGSCMPVLVAGAGRIPREEKGFLSPGFGVLSFAGTSGTPDMQKEIRNDTKWRNERKRG